MLGEVDEEAEFEKRIADLKRSKGETPYGETRKSPASSQSLTTSSMMSPVCSASKPKYDFSDESIFYEGSPHTGDVMVNVALGATLVWLPLTAASVARKAFVKYKVTDKRVSVITEAPWKSEQLDVAYEEVSDVVAIGRGVGAWGDMVITLKNGDKVEIRSLDKLVFTSTTCFRIVIQMARDKELRNGEDTEIEGSFSN